MYQVKINGRDYWPLVTKEQLDQIIKEMAARGCQVTAIQASRNAIEVNPIFEYVIGIARDHDLHHLGLQNVKW